MPSTESRGRGARRLSPLAPPVAAGSRHGRDPRRAGLGPLALPVAAFLLYALTSPGLARGDAVGVYLTAGALVERARPAIDGAIAALAPVAPGADAGPAAYGPLAYAAGHYYHTAPPGPALVAAPSSPASPSAASSCSTTGWASWASWCC